MISIYVHISNLLQVYVVIVGQERERENKYVWPCLEIQFLPLNARHLMHSPYTAALADRYIHKPVTWWDIPQSHATRANITVKKNVLSPPLYKLYTIPY